MDKAAEKIEQIIISAMTNDGEYKVEDVGEHATEIAKALIFNGYRLPPKEEDLPLLTSMCAEGKHLLCLGDLAGDNWSTPSKCECVCHKIVDALMLDNHIQVNDARVMASRVAGVI